MIKKNQLPDILKPYSKEINKFCKYRNGFWKYNLKKRNLKSVYQLSTTTMDILEDHLRNKAENTFREILISNQTYDTFSNFRKTLRRWIGEFI